MSVYFLIDDIHNVGSITIEQALHIGKYFSQYVLKEDDGFIYSRLGFLYAKLEEYEKAIFYLDKAYEIDQNDDFTAYHLGKTYRKMNNTLKAIEIFDKSFEHTEFKGYVALELAICYALSNQKEKAENYYNEAKILVDNEEDLQEAEHVIQMMNNPKYFS